MSSLLFPIAKQVMDVVEEYLMPDVGILNGLLPSLLINIVIWFFAPFIALLALLSFLFYSVYTLASPHSH